jgi:hypothetical protein
MTLTAALAVALLTAAAPPQTAPDPVAEFEALCLATRGEDAAIEAAALARGYAPTQPRPEEDMAGLPHNPPPRAWSRIDGGVETRVLSDQGVMVVTGPWQRVHRCYVSAPGERTAARTTLVGRTGVDPFRRGESFIFAWTEAAGGRTSVSQRDYERRLEPLMRDHGLQTIRVSEFRSDLTLTYMTAAE